MECEIVIDSGGIFQSYESIEMFDLSTPNIFCDSLPTGLLSKTEGPQVAQYSYRGMFFRIYW